MSQPSIIAERLLAHARICRDIADATMNEETAIKLERLAEGCVQAAREAVAESRPEMFPRPGREPPGDGLNLFRTVPIFLLNQVFPITAPLA